MQFIGTHNGKFHCDEVFACYMLKVLPAFENHVIVRTRDLTILKTCDIVVDVGGEYDVKTKRFDHHQRQFSDTMNTLLNMNYHTKLSSAGLIYAHYGKEVIAKILKIEISNPNIDILYDKLYQIFVESVDAIDNGVQQYDGVPRYQLSSTLTTRVRNLNPSWNDKDSMPDIEFAKAMKVVGEEFEDRVKYLYNVWFPARDFVYKCVENRKETHESGKIVELKPNNVPWKDHFFNIERDLALESEEICLVMYLNESDSSWRIQAIPSSKTSGFLNRINLPWKGFRNKDLEKESGIEGAIFVHSNGFIGGAKTRSGALAIADEAIRQAAKI